MPGSGFDLYVDAGYGAPGITAGYTNSVSGYLTDWSASYNSPVLWGAGTTPDFQYDALTFGSPGGSVTYGAEFENLMYDIANGIDWVLLH